MNKTNGTTLTFEFDKATQRKFRYKQVLPAHDDPTRDAECPMIYLDKDFVKKRLGNSQVIEVVVKGLIPDD